MKRHLIITIGILIILFVLGMWVYLLVYGTPQKTSEVFANLGFIAPSEIVPVFVEPVVIDENTSQLSLGGARLEQLTTRAVAGSAFASTTKPLLWYVEQGTGYIFEIDLDTGIETQISLTTIPQAAEAVFSPKAVAITSYEGYVRKVIAGLFTKDGSEIDFVKLPSGANDVVFDDEDTLQYTLTKDGQTIGYSFDIEDLSSSELFRVGIPDLKTRWGFPLTEIFVSTKPSKLMEGNTYKVSKNKLIPVTPSRYGLTSFMNDLYIVAAHVEQENYVTESIHNGVTARQGLLMISEKCVLSQISAQQTWCAAPAAVQNGDYLEDWYKGKIVSKDYLWRTSLDNQTSTLVADLAELSGKMIDVMNISLNAHEDLLLITNKTDRTLWIYRI
jgi:hypothetical protein